MNGVSGDEGRGGGIGASDARERGLPVFMEKIKRWEWWFGKVGILLLLFGVMLLFKYSWDEGWLKVLLTPVVRVGLGLGIGSALVGLGLRVYGERRGYAWVFLGGGIGVFYMAGFAASSMYGLVPYGVAFAFMVCVTVLAFALSLRQSEASLAVIGVSGGLATPFLLYSQVGPLSGLVLYTSVILAGASAVYLVKGWSSLLVVAGAGSWLVFLVGYLEKIHPVESARGSEHWALQFGVAFAWIVLWLAPVIREVLRERRPNRRPALDPGVIGHWFTENGIVLRPGILAHVASVTVPLVALFFTQGIWSLGTVASGGVSLVAAVVYAGAASGLRSVEGGRALAYTQGLVAVLLGTLAAGLLLDADVFLFVLAAEAAVLHLVGYRLRDRLVTGLAHALFAVVVAWFEYRLLSGAVDGMLHMTSGDAGVAPAYFGVRALADFAVVALAFGVSVVLPRPVARVYRVAAHAGALGVIGRELLHLPNGDTYVLLAWALYALALHGISRYLPAWGMTTGAHALSAFAGLWLAARLVTGYVDWVSTGLDAGADFGFVGVADFAMILFAFAASRVVGEWRLSSVYRIAASGALSLWLLRELSVLDPLHGYVLLGWTLFAAALMFAARRLGDENLLMAAHVQLVAAGGVLLLRVFAGLALGPQGLPVIGPGSLVDLGAILTAAFASRFTPTGELKVAYRGLAHVALLAWFWRELSVLPGGDALVSIAWGLYASGLMVVGLRVDRAWIARGGMVTLFVVVGKLFVWDLAGVETIWRILLFLGFGGLFLGLGYYLQSLWKPGAETRDRRPVVVFPGDRKDTL